MNLKKAEEKENLKSNQSKQTEYLKKMPVRFTGDFSSVPLEVRNNGMVFLFDERKLNATVKYYRLQRYHSIMRVG